jgi:hypothetical protein
MRTELECNKRDLEDHLLSEAIESFSNILSNNGCNDLYIPNTEEARLLWDEYQAWNLKTPLTELKGHVDYWPPYVDSKNRLVVYDSLFIYLLRKRTGLLD